MIGRPPVPQRALLLLDYDGTLAPIVADPGKAVPHPDVPALLRTLGAIHPTYVITGRDLATLGRLLVDDAGRAVSVAAVGLHGAEEGRLGGPTERLSHPGLSEPLQRLRDSVPSLDGVHVEEKGSAAFAVHYRRASEPEVARAALERWAADTPAGLEALWGKMVVELRPAGVSKGHAVARIARRHPDRVPVYLGDDTTDEEAFVVLNAQPQAITVKVGPEPTSARYRLPDTGAVVEYLSALAPRTHSADPR